MLYAEILLPLYQPLYTFSAAEELGLHEGDAVEVQFGKNSYYTGIVWHLHRDAPQNLKNIKAVRRRLYSAPLLTSAQMRFWEWIADYYMCRLGEVMRMALPALVKPHAATEEEYAAKSYALPTERWVVLHAAAVDVDAPKERSKRRLAVVEFLRSQGGAAPRRTIDAAADVLRQLEQSGVVGFEERTVERDCTAEPIGALPQLSPAQQTALEGVAALHDKGKIALLRGVTGSGKTEIYMHLIAEELRRGGDVLYLVPEIALTAQLVERLQRVFGSRVTVYHSQLTPARRTETYLRLCDADGGQLVIGARSAVFMPLHRLRLVVVDEEHDQSYKQTEPAPRYNGRDSAIMLASQLHAHVVLGSATPSVESYANALSGKYGEVVLSERYGGAQMPQFIISDTIRAVKRGERKSHFNKILLDKIADRLEHGEQTILFQNRRGYAPYVSCKACGWTPHCPDCNVTLTQHSSRLECHYCGHSEPLPTRCPECGATQIEPMGFGTEKVEQEISALFPSARVLRLDRDTATSPSAYRRTITAFARGEADILVGTQIVAKGLDFERVTLIGILNADNLLGAPDFRASERAFQMITQVAGRGGRRAERGEVVVQTTQPDDAVLAYAAADNYCAMARAQLSERAQYYYPPYVRLVRITMRHRDRQTLYLAAAALAEGLRAKFGRRVFGPVPPPVDRVRDEYISCLMLKIESGASMQRARGIVRDCMEQITKAAEYRATVIICDVDIQ